jgi:biopolymer transport protein TolR
MLRRRLRKRFMSDINVVPYIDVMLVLLVIFMITAPLLDQGVEIQLPKATTEPLPPTQQEPFVLSVDRNGLYYLNSTDNPLQSIDAEELVTLTAAALSQDPQLPVLVKADEMVNYGVVMQAMALLQQAGAAEVGLLTTLPDEP